MLRVTLYFLCCFQSKVNGITVLNVPYQFHYVIEQLTGKRIVPIYVQCTIFDISLLGGWGDSVVHYCNLFSCVCVCVSVLYTGC